MHKDQFKQLLVPTGLAGKSSGVSKKNLAASETHTIASSEQNNSDSDECLSTDGDESELNSPLMRGEKQFLNQAVDLKTALINSKALVGDYIELKNCKRCGSMIFKDHSSAIKPKSEEFNADISPAQLLTKMFQDEARYKVDHYIQPKDLENASNKIARVYSEQRDKLIERLFSMGKKFNQRLKTTHIAIEILDRFFLDRQSQNMRDF